MDYFDARFGTYLAVIALLIITPGPDMALVTRNALLAGRRVASFTTLGIATGSIFWGLMLVFGIATLLERSVVAFTVCKYVGAAYLGYLGLRSLISSFRGEKHAKSATEAPRVQVLSKQAAYKQGLLGNLLNPKAGAIFATILPQFIRPGDSALRLVLMMLAFETILLVWLNLYGYLVNRAGQSRFGTRTREVMNRITGVVLIALGLRLVWEQR
jgi:threonine/homoserine/homoserine lactone efflux protein